ncbi:MAG: ABC transporter permease [Alphaproteobacteria bacterium]|nr:ABC transporter permease [Alphaproteobacteria bacterium]
MIDRFKKIIALIKKEFLIIWKDPKSRGIIIALPIVQLILFANAITMEVKNIKVAVIDLDKTVESRELIAKFENSPQFEQVKRIDNIHQMQKLIDNQEIEMGLYIQNDFSTLIKSKTPTDILIITDGRQTNSAAIIAGYASQIIMSYSHEVSPTNGAVINIIPRHWYNPNLEYRWFILTIIVVMLAVIVTLLLTALSIAREREMGTFDQLIVSPLSSIDILIGKTIPPLCVAMVLSCFMSFAVTYCFGVPFVGSVFSFLIAMFISLMSMVGVGLYISSICSTQQQAVFGIIAFLMPAVLLSGFISPIEDMPKFLQYLTYANPIRFFMSLAREICLKGISTIDLFINSVPLIFISVVTLSLASWSFKQQKS